MNDKLMINTNLLRKESEFRTKSCVVEKAIAVSHAEFENLKRHPLQYNELIAENADLMYCDSDDNYGEKNKRPFARAFGERFAVS